HLERRAPDDAEHERRPAIVTGGLSSHLAYERFVVELDATAKRVGHQLLGESANEHLGTLEHRLTERDGTIDLRAVRQLSRRVDRAARLLLTPLPEAVEVLERKTERVHHAVTARARRVPAVRLEPRAQRSRLRAWVVLL